jgi:hypothetical protein
MDVRAVPLIDSHAGRHSGQDIHNLLLPLAYHATQTLANLPLELRRQALPSPSALSSLPTNHRHFDLLCDRVFRNPHLPMYANISKLEHQPPLPANHPLPLPPHLRLPRPRQLSGQYPYRRPLRRHTHTRRSQTPSQQTQQSLSHRGPLPRFQRLYRWDFQTRLQVTTVKAMDSAFHNRFQVLYLLELCLRILADSLPTLKSLLAVALGGKRDTEAEVEVEKVHADTSHLSPVPAACGPNPLSSLLWMEATELGHHERNCGAADASFA